MSLITFVSLFEVLIAQTAGPPKLMSNNNPGPGAGVKKPMPPIPGTCFLLFYVIFKHICHFGLICLIINAFSSAHAHPINRE